MPTTAEVVNPTGEYVAGLVALSVARSTDTFTAKTGDLTLYYNLSSLVVAATERRLVVGGEGGSIAIHESCSGEVYQTVAGTSNNTRVNTYGKATKETRDGLDYAVVAGTMVVNNGYVKSCTWWWYSWCNFRYRQQSEHTGPDHFDCCMYTNLYLYLFS
jgi:hypothetical protein